MKKVGVMTWYKYYNYGTVLQVFALTSIIKELGYDTSIINYSPRPFIDIPDLSLKSVITKTRQKILSKLTQHNEVIPDKRKRLFDNFKEQFLKETKPLDNAIELSYMADQMDAIVCGSDQIWAPSCFDDKYFLSFVRDKTRMIAYAPSIGLLAIKNSVIAEKMKSLIESFHFLSVREKQGADIIESLCGKKARVVLDPTLLYSKNKWNQLLENNNNFDDKEKTFFKKPYAICYFLGDSRRYKKAIRKLKKALSIDVFVIPIFDKQINSAHSIPFEVGPCEFIQLIANAKYVMTDSFHGLLFSIIYNKPFTVFKRFDDDDEKNQNSRIFNILSLLKLESRLCELSSFSPTKDIYNCDFAIPNRILKKERANSLEFLISSLSKVTGEEKSIVSSVSILQYCCGCGACIESCPVSAIVVKRNENGFYEKYVDNTRCIKCKKCLKVCPMYHVEAKELQQAKALYAYKSLDLINIRTNSSSGGIGSDVANYLSDQGFFIIGSVYDNSKNGACHIVVKDNNKKQLCQFKGSKYIQSFTAEAMSFVKNNAYSKIAFFGTPCQVAAMDKILTIQNRRNQAVLIDLICHGVPTHNLWKKYLKLRNRVNHIGENPTVFFRSREKEWRKLEILVKGNNHVYSANEKNDVFYSFFRMSLCNIPSCYECPYREKSAADIRIGDYWGPRYIDDKTGVSMCIINSDRGKILFEQLDGRKTQHDINEYWTVQYPYNQQEPLFYDSLQKGLKNKDENLQELYNCFAKPFVQREKLQTIISMIKNILY